MPLRETGCGIGVSVGDRVGIIVGVDVGDRVGVSVGGRVGVNVDVDVGDGIGVFVEVGTIVADGSIAICPLQAVSNTAKNKSIAENCEVLFFTLFSRRFDFAMDKSMSASALLSAMDGFHAPKNDDNAKAALKLAVYAGTAATQIRHSTCLCTALYQFDELLHTLVP